MMENFMIYWSGGLSLLLGIDFIVEVSRGGASIPILLLFCGAIYSGRKWSEMNSEGLQ